MMKNWSRIIIWPPLFVGGILVTLAASRASRLRRAIRRVFHRQDRSPQSLSLLRCALVGNDKQAIAAILGPPRTVLHFSGTAKVMRPDCFLDADTWYYPIDHARRSIIAIHFRRDIAAASQVIPSTSLVNSG